MMALFIEAQLNVSMTLHSPPDIRSLRIVVINIIVPLKGELHDHGLAQLSITSEWIAKYPNTARALTRAHLQDEILKIISNTGSWC
jgi:hypothetical protein